MPRLVNDAYMTPEHYTAALLSEVNVFGRVYEPCVGDGAIANRLERLPQVRRVYTNDISKRYDADTHYDARIEIPAYDTGFDWIVTNPPFSDEYAILDFSFPHTKNLAFLARLSFLEPTEERADFLENNPPHQIIVLPRHSFRKNDQGKTQTDNVTCCWLVWLADGQPRRTAVYGRAKAKTMALFQELP